MDSNNLSNQKPKNNIESYQRSNNYSTKNDVILIMKNHGRMFNIDYE